LNFFKLYRAPIAIGKSFKSGDDMYMSAMKGKCLNILNIYKDNLWALGDKSLEVPLISPATFFWGPKRGILYRDNRSKKFFFEFFWHYNQK
jgi:hypothetical protein